MLAGKFSGPDEMFMEARDHAGVLGVSQPARKEQCFGGVQHPEICAGGREISITIVEEALRSGNTSTRFFDKRVCLPAHATGVPSRRTFIKNGSRPCSSSACRAGRAEIVAAARTIAAGVRSGDLPLDAVDEELIAQHLFTAELPDPDLLIRTSGEQRISNFLLWQCAYAELVFVDTLWPDFGKEHLERAVAEFRRRERRYGGVGC